MLSVVSCASMSGSPFVSGDEPHARLEAVINAQVSDELFPAILADIDGRNVPAQNRRTYLLPPGEHTISLKPDRDKIQEYEDMHGRNFELPRLFFERPVRITLEEGKTYRFGVRIHKYNYADWKPVIEPVEE